MAAVQRLSLAPGFNPDRVLPAISSEYFAVPTTRTVIGVWSFDKLELRHKPLELQGHRKAISALAFGNEFNSRLLCSCAEDYVFVWNISDCQRNYEERKQIKGEIIGTSLGEPNHCAFSADDLLVAVCVDIDVYVLKSDSQKTVAILDGHLSRVTGAEFCPHYLSTLVTISDDRTFKIWDLENQIVVYQSCVITSFSLVSLCMNWSEPSFSVGSADGLVRTFDLTDGNDFRTLYQLDIESISRKFKSSKLQPRERSTGPNKISSRSTWNKSEQFIPQMDYSKETDGSSSSAIVGIWYSFPNSHSMADNSKPYFLKNAMTDVLSNRSTTLLVATTSYLFQIDPKTLETIDVVDLTDPIPAEGSFASSSVTLNSLNCAVFSHGSHLRDLWIVVGTLFENRLHVLDWTLAQDDHVSSEQASQNVDSAMELLSLAPDLNPDRQTATKSSELSLIAVNPLAEHSLLTSKLEPAAKPKLSGAGNKKKMGASIYATKKSNPINQPLTFKTKVKSSGYVHQGPKTKLFQPQTGRRGSNLVIKRSTSLDAAMLKDEYPLDCGHPNELLAKRSLCEVPTRIVSLRFTGNGHQLACGLANRLAITYTIPLKKTGTIYQGHDGNVNSVYWSHDNSMMLTASDDRTVNMWMAGSSSEPIMKITNTNNNLSSTENQTATNPTFTKEMKYAQFYYMDKFILLISGNSLYMYKYHNDTSKDDIKRYLSKSKYKLVKSWQTDSQTLTALSAVNSFYSHMAVCAGSNRSIELFDMNVGCSAAIIDEAHARPVHAISLNEGSGYVSQPSAAYNVFATVAIADCIKLWDIRSQKCVQRFEGHHNKALPCGIAVSPCGRYLASGSEDKLTYIFDIRTGTYCERLRGHGDVVSTVVYHPSKPILVSGSIDGNVVLYKPDSWNK